MEKSISPFHHSKTEKSISLFHHRKMNRKQEPHLVDNLRRATNDSFGVHYCIGQCLTLSLSHPTTLVLYTSKKTPTAKFNSSLQSVLPTGVFHQQPENWITQAKHSMVKQNWTVTLIRQLRVATAPYCTTHKDNLMWRRLQTLTIPQKCWHCVGSHRIHIGDWPTINPSISLGLVYAGTWSYPDQYQPIAPVPHTSPRQSMQYYRTNEYYQSNRILYSVLWIPRDKSITQHLVYNPDRPGCITTYRIVFTPTVESTSYWFPLKKIIWRRILRRKMCLVLASNYINELKMMNVKSQMTRTSYSTHNISTR